MKLDNPLLVRWEYASEERLEKRNAVLRALSRGSSPEDASVAAVAALQPRRLLDVGCGLGEHGERFQNELRTHVCGIDISPRMVELSKARGLAARLADVDSRVLTANGALRAFVASTIDRAHLAPQVPDISGPFHARTRHVIVVAKGPL